MHEYRRRARPYSVWLSEPIESPTNRRFVASDDEPINLSDRGIDENYRLAYFTRRVGIISILSINLNDVFSCFFLNFFFLFLTWVAYFNNNNHILLTNFYIVIRKNIPFGKCHREEP